MNYRHKLMVFLVAAVSFLGDNITDFFIVVILIDRYTIIASNESIFTSSIFIFGSSSIYLRMDAWTMETCE